MHTLFAKEPYIHSQKSPAYLCKKALYLCKRALYLCKRALEIHQNVVCVCKRALCTFTAAPSSLIYDVSCAKELCKYAQKPNTYATQCLPLLFAIAAAPKGSVNTQKCLGKYAKMPCTYAADPYAYAKEHYAYAKEPGTHAKEPYKYARQQRLIHNQQNPMHTQRSTFLLY